MTGCYSFRRRGDLMKRVVISGIGVVATCGVGKEVFWQHLESGRSLSRFDEEMASMGINSKVVCRLDDFNVYQYCDPGEFPNLHEEDRFIQFGVVAGKQALEDAGQIGRASCRERV